MRRMFHPRTIRGKLTGWLLAAYVLFSLIYIYTYLGRYHDQRRMVTQDHLRITQLLALSVSNFLDSTSKFQIAAGHWLVGRGPVTKSCSKYLRKVRASHPDHLSDSFLDPRGRLVGSDPPNSGNPDLGSQADVRRVISGAVVGISAHHRNAAGRMVFDISSAITANGKMLGIVRTEMDAQCLERLLPAKFSQAIMIVATDSGGSEVYRDTSDSLRLRAEQLRRAAFYRGAVERHAPEAEIFTLPGVDGQLLGSAVPLSLTNWIVLSVRPAGDALQHSKADLVRGLSASLGLTAAFLLLFWLRSGVWLGDNLRRLTRGAAALAVGDLRKRIHVQTGDELEKLAVAFNQMAESLQAHERHVQSRSTSLQGLLDVAQVVMSSLDIEVVATAVLQAVHRRYGAISAAIYLCGEDARDIDLLAYNRHSHPLAENPPEEWRALAARALRRKAVEVSAPSSGGQQALSLTGLSPDVFIAVPLVAADRQVGVLVGRFAGDELAEPAELEERMDLLRVFGSHAAMGLQNAESYARVEAHSSSLAAWLDELSALRYVTEAITASLDLREVQQTLARLTCDVVKASSSVILHMDARGDLKVSESHNLSSEMRKACECRLGEPVAGLAAIQQRPLSVSNLVKQYPDHPMAIRAAEEGLYGFLSTPLIGGGEVIGTIDIWMAKPCEFTQGQMDLVSSIAAHAAMVIQNARLFGKEYRIAETLQNVLLGNLPRDLVGIEIGCKYAPALEEARVGGDFYDVFLLPEDKIGIVIADVSGKGLEAAMQTAMCKYMLRGFAHHMPDSPAEVLRMVNEALCDYADSKFYITVFYCVLDIHAGKLTYANAGHPPPIWITESGEKHTLLYQTGMPVGLECEKRYQQRGVETSAGDILVMYTDGLMDARQGVNTLGIEGLQDILFSLDPQQSVQALVEQLYRQTLLYSRDGARDDMAVVAAQIVGVDARTPVEAKWQGGIGVDST